MLRPMRNRLIVAGALSVLWALAPSAAAAEDEGFRTRLQLSLGAVAGNNVLPAPLAPGVSVLVERRHFGFEAGMQVDPVIVCDKDSREDSCGVLVSMDVGGRASLPLGRSFVVYLSTRLQWLRMTKADDNELGVAFRPGVAYQRQGPGQRFGAFVEAGPTVLFGDHHDYPTVRRDGSKIVPMAMAGIRL